MASYHRISGVTSEIQVRFVFYSNFGAYSYVEMGGNEQRVGFLVRLSHVFTKLLSHEQDVTQGHILRVINLVGMQSFHSPRLIATPRLNGPVCLVIYT